MMQAVWVQAGCCLVCFSVWRHNKTTVKTVVALCSLHQDWQAQSTVSVTAHGWHKSSIQALGAALSLDQNLDGGVFQTGRHYIYIFCLTGLRYFLFVVCHLAMLFILFHTNSRAEWQAPLWACFVVDSFLLSRIFFLLSKSACSVGLYPPLLSTI